MGQCQAHVKHIENRVKHANKFQLEWLAIRQNVLWRSTQSSLIATCDVVASSEGQIDSIGVFS